MFFCIEKLAIDIYSVKVCLTGENNLFAGMFLVPFALRSQLPVDCFREFCLLFPFLGNNILQNTK